MQCEWQAVYLLYWGVPFLYYLMCLWLFLGYSNIWHFSCNNDLSPLLRFTIWTILQWISAIWSFQWRWIYSSVADFEFERYPFWHVNLPSLKSLSGLTSQSDINSKFQRIFNILGGRIKSIPPKLISFSSMVYMCVHVCVWKLCIVLYFLMNSTNS